MIDVRNISKKYRLGKVEIRALNDVSMNIEKGEFICVMGPSGSGKSTLLNIIGCLDRPDCGEVFIDGDCVADLDRNMLADIRINKIGFIFQTFNLIPVLNVFENIEFPLYIKGERLSAGERKKRIMKVIEEVGLENQVRQKPDELSGGQRQRVAIARAMVSRPLVILADEPTANLDSATASSILETMKRLNKEDNVTFIFSTHDLAITQYSTHLYRLKDGSLV
jgi:putative ABC transport system ATP-binding protein